MKPQPTLFDLPAPDKTCSTAAQLTAFCKLHGILTHKAGPCHDRTDRWMALLPIPEHKGKPIYDIMAEWCRVYDESNRIATGPGKLSAVRALCKLQNIPCDL